MGLRQTPLPPADLDREVEFSLLGGLPHHLLHQRAEFEGQGGPAVSELRNASGLTNQERRYGRRCPRRLGHRILPASERPDRDLVGMLRTNRCGAEALKAGKPARKLESVDAAAKYLQSSSLTSGLW